MKRFALLAATLLLASPGWADGLYALGELGQSKFNLDTSDVDNLATQVGGTFSKGETDTAYKLQVGYQFSPYWAVEGGYVDLGKASYNFATRLASAQGEYKASGLNAAVLGMWPLNDQFSLFGKVGAIYAHVKAEGSNSLGESESFSSNGLKPAWGIGVNWDISAQMAARAEYEQFHELGNTETGKTTVDLASVGLAYRF